MSPSWFTVTTLEVGVPLAVLLAHGVDGRRRGERVARPHLLHEPHAIAREPAVTHPVGEDAAGHAHREHAVREHAGEPRDLGAYLSSLCNGL